MCAIVAIFQNSAPLALTYLLYVNFRNRQTSPLTLTVRHMQTTICFWVSFSPNTRCLQDRRKQWQLLPAGYWRWWRKPTSRGAGKPCAVLPTARWWKSGQRGTAPEGFLESRIRGFQFVRRSTFQTLCRQWAAMSLSWGQRLEGGMSPQDTQQSSWESLGTCGGNRFSGIETGTNVSAVRTENSKGSGFSAYSDLTLISLQTKYEYAPGLTKWQENTSAPMRSMPKTEFALINRNHIHKHTCKPGLKPIRAAALHIPLCIHNVRDFRLLSCRHLHEVTEEISRKFSSHPQPILLLTPRPHFWECPQQCPLHTKM